MPLEVQDMLIAGTGEHFIVKDIDAGHNAQIVVPEKMVDIFLELAKKFEEF